MFFFHDFYQKERFGNLLSVIFKNCSNFHIIIRLENLPVMSLFFNFDSMVHEMKFLINIFPIFVNLFLTYSVLQGVWQRSFRIQASCWQPSLTFFFFFFLTLPLQDGNMICEKEDSCPPLNCSEEDQLSVQGECCPVCRGKLPHYCQ